MEHEDVRSSESTDAKTTQDLIETLVDGQNGYAEAGSKLADDGNLSAAHHFQQMAGEREQMASDLRTMAAEYGDLVDSDGSTAAAAHRVWIGLKDALTGTDASAIIDAAKGGEDHAIEQFEQALGEDISADLRSTVGNQLSRIRSARSQLDRLRTD